MLSHTCKGIVFIGLFGVLTSAAPASITYFDIFYGRWSYQTSADQPTDIAGYSGSHRIFTDTPIDLSSAVVLYPDGSTEQPLNQETPWLYSWYSPTFNSEEDLSAAVPRGDYHYQIAGGTLGPVDALLNLPSETYWPDRTPYFTNWDDMQQVDPNQDFSVTFESWTSDVVANFKYTYLTIYDPQSNTYVVSTVFPNTDQNYVIPAGTLSPDTSYQIIIYFSSRELIFDAGFATGISEAGFDSSTIATLVTTGGCSADFNHDNIVDFFDYLDFVGAFSANDPTADFNNDLIIDFFDYLDFVSAFSIGC